MATTHTRTIPVSLTFPRFSAIPGKTDDENNRGQREITGFAVIYLIINQHTQTGSSDHTIQQE